MLTHPTLLRAATITLLLAGPAAAQTHYRNLDAGQPGRIEDALVTGQYSLAIDLSPIAFERLAGGSTRYRGEPKIAYGILPFTQLEIRAPLVELVPPASSGAASNSGVAGLAIGVMHAFNVETNSRPALALSGEVSLPVGSLAGSQGAFFIKGLATKSISSVRFHMNAGVGTYSIGSPKRSSTDCQSSGVRLVVAGDTTCNTGPIVIFDAPCSVAPRGPRLTASAARFCMAAPAPADSLTTAPTKTNGNRWFAGLGVDHAFPLRSTLVTADVFVERFVGLYATADWTAEVGLRRQLTPIIVVNAGGGRHFAGAIPSTFVMGGVSFEFATPPLLGR